jgi:uncharacterized C2H2 Zn-finger protein
MIFKYECERCGEKFRSKFNYLKHLKEEEIEEAWDFDKHKRQANGTYAFTSKY